MNLRLKAFTDQMKVFCDNNLLEKLKKKIKLVIVHEYFHNKIQIESCERATCLCFWNTCEQADKLILICVSQHRVLFV